MQTEPLCVTRAATRTLHGSRRVSSAHHSRAFIASLSASLFAVLVGLPARVGAEAAPDSTASRNRNVVRALFDAMNRADTAKLDELYAEDFEIWTAGVLPISGTRTRAQALEGMGMIDAMFPSGIRFEIIAMTAEGERVAVEAQSEGIHASGKRYHNQYHFLVIIRDGKIHQLKEYMDTMHAKDVLMAPSQLKAPPQLKAPSADPSADPATEVAP